MWLRADDVRRDEVVVEIWSKLKHAAVWMLQKASFQFQLIKSGSNIKLKCSIEEKQHLLLNDKKLHFACKLIWC